jgi:benzodiazapine receptor
MRKDTVRQAVNVVLLLATIALNGLATALPLNGQTTGDISDRFDVYFVPAGYVFSIWGLIYLALTAFVIYQALASQRDNPRLRRIGYLFALSCAANVTWLFLWHYEIFPLTIVAMVVLLISLIAIYLRQGIGRTEAPTAEKLLVRVPFSIYLGWITVATIANASSLLDHLNWSGWGIRPEVWAVIMLLMATAVTSGVALTRGDVAFALVIAWALAGIAVKHAETPIVSTTAWIVTVMVALVMAMGAWLNRREKPSSALTG